MKSAAWTVVVLALLGPWAPGCSAVRPLTKAEADPRAAKVDPESNKGAVELDANPDVLNRAITEALADLKMEYIRTRKDGAVTQIDARTADQRAVSMTIRPGLEGKSRFSSRIGWFGDTLLSKALAERVGIRAGLLPPKPIPDQLPSAPDPNPLFSRSAVSDDEMFRDLADAPYRDRVIP